MYCKLTLTKPVLFHYNYFSSFSSLFLSTSSFFLCPLFSLFSILTFFSHLFLLWKFTTVIEMCRCFVHMGIGNSSIGEGAVSQLQVNSHRTNNWLFYFAISHGTKELQEHLQVPEFQAMQLCEKFYEDYLLLRFNFIYRLNEDRFTLAASIKSCLTYMFSLNFLLLYICNIK